MASILYSCQQNTASTESAAAETSAEALATTYGADFAPGEDIIAADQLLKALAGKDSVETTVQAVINESCQAKGCWMDVKLGNSETMKVTFKDYGFFLPVEDLTGREVIFRGTAKREMISVEDQRHFAKDAGKSEEEIALITEPREEFRFVADGVKLKQ
ncbi:DUF4920 domain-containing protein [Pontibacter oryzae]|uniref:DUF4920 domain-containing protein n=2 Tax=Pontibacter oryzae TaxID=2304593 RepID=A0A399SJ15_9BACT|nr:DUF4920 domain-containing protein [Pontibacter oryzae]